MTTYIYTNKLGQTLEVVPLWGQMTKLSTKEGLRQAIYIKTKAGDRLRVWLDQIKKNGDN